MANGKGGSNAVLMVIIFFVVVFALSVLYTIGQNFIKFSDRNPGVVLLAVAICLLIWFKVFKDKMTSNPDRTDRENKLEEAKMPIQDFRNSFSYGQRESIIITLNMISTVFNSIKPYKSEIDYISSVGKLLGIDLNDPLYYAILSRHNSHSGFMAFISSMDQRQKEYLCVLADNLINLTAKWDRNKKDVAKAILLDAGISEEEYRRAIVNSSHSISKYLNQ